MPLVPEKCKPAKRRNLEVSRTYLRRGQAVSRSLWIRVSPRHPLLKVVMVPPMAVFMLGMLVLILIMLGFALLAVALMQAIGRTGDGKTQEG